MVPQKEIPNKTERANIAVKVRTGTDQTSAHSLSNKDQSIVPSKKANKNHLITYN